ncbi:amino acid ABC transporter substrate-binding protein [Hydrogenophaga crassostreae]|uniref:Amino acid ABC transporter substrate-binding protein n=1 Tax=Hydrogenophaga crassostreae TaxID=1763535 RepID=A0A163C649_9BURK|nr:ABC transporter substrate-binding protein [Hydrogenophaga crassostreae]AOW14793.1 amino acid ABC transporter substrate-binding protein [Hydrogenophaga crassostreae]OAD39621.1 amino acid ABC transporter substrate-binding protein [Hydrogenophaga crassostreae]
MRKLKIWCLGATLTMAVTFAQAQILIGQTAGFSGPVAAGVKETTDGAKLYFDAINAKGGVGGQKIELISLDDQFDPKQAAENGRILVEERQVLSLFLTRGTPHTQALFPLLDKTGVPLVGPSTGAMVMHTPVQKTLFNVRATYQREAESLASFLTALGPASVGIVHADDSFGRDALEGAMAGFTKAGYPPSVIVPADRSKPNFDEIIPALLKAKVQSVLWFGSGTSVSSGVKALREANSVAQVATLSNNASSGFIKGLGEFGRGVIVSQVYPGVRNADYPMVNEARKLAKVKGIELSPAMLEGYAAAKVLVEGLRRAGANPSRGGLVKALETMRPYDLGGLIVDYSSTDHTGLNYSDYSIIGPSGKFRR